jgi:hypothetical protein
MPSIQEHGPFYWHLARLQNPVDTNKWVSVRQYEWPYKWSSGRVIRLGQWGLLLGIWHSNPDLYSKSEEELLIDAIEASSLGYFKEQQIGKAKNVEWVPIEDVKGIKGNW